jgi:hypothetical protein
MDIRLEIADDRIVCRYAGEVVLVTSVTEFVTALRQGADYLALPDAIPEGVRFIRRRDDVVVLVVEDLPQARTVRWLAEDSPHPKGPSARYETVRLSFPFVVFVMAFRNGAITDFHQCFFRTSPLRTLADALYFPNLYNTAAKGRQASRLCLLGLDTTQLVSLAWAAKVDAIKRHFWNSTFNQSVEMGGHPSHWQTMRHVDPRVSSVARWARETQTDPLFALRVRWQPCGQSVGEVIASAMSAVSASCSLASVEDLAAMATRCRAYRKARSSGSPSTGRRDER